MKSTVTATLVASMVGTGAWLIGLSGTFWPAQPLLATLILTVVTYAAVKFAWRSRIAR